MKTINILALGDITGENAVIKLEKELKSIKTKFNIDFVIANGENAEKARGITKELFNRIIESGVDVITMGNHTFSNNGIHDIDDDRLIIPANIDENLLNKGYNISNCKDTKIFVCNLMGKDCVPKPELNAFKVARKIFDEIDSDIKIRVIDFHAGFCNQKRVLAHYLKDEVSIIFGTHTHVQTADESILYNKIGYITDVGMCGPINSAIGYDLDFETRRFTEELRDDSILANDSNCMINGCIFKVDVESGKTIEIKRVNYK